MAGTCQAHLAACRRASTLLGGTKQKAGDACLTWGTVQLLQRLAAALWCHLCPLAEEGETDMTCRAAPRRLGQHWGGWWELKAQPQPLSWQHALSGDSQDTFFFFLVVVP